MSHILTLIHVTSVSPRLSEVKTIHWRRAARDRSWLRRFKKWYQRISKAYELQTRYTDLLKAEELFMLEGRITVETDRDLG